MKNYTKYLPYPKVEMVTRKWPNNSILKAPIWCSVDLRDGNQALEIPMSLEQKLIYFDYLVKLGFKEIEIGFPAASDTEYEFARTLIENNLIPSDVTIQVLTQARDEIIKKTFEAVKGAKKAIIHLYNSTSTLQRDVVFSFNKQQTIDLAVSGAKLVMKYAMENRETCFNFEYSPESFTGTEIDFAVEICNEVIDVWKPTKDRKVIINLPSTVEMSTPNIYADQIEYVSSNLNNRQDIIISLHTHNDRGTAVAASELGLLAGADRIEGTIFGNGERTGNVDIVNLGLNLFTQGVDPMLDLEDINKIIHVYENITGMHISKRHPYAGELVYTAFSGSHQDAIKKGMKRMKGQISNIWSVPYLPIDPMDVGRNYDPIIRVNSQSGKGGVSFLLEKDYGLIIPREMQKNFSEIITNISDKNHTDLSSKEIYEIFKNEYLDIQYPVSLEYYNELGKCGVDDIKIEAKIKFNADLHKINGEGNGVLAAFSSALEEFLNIKLEIVDYREHSLTHGTHSSAISYIQIIDDKGNSYFGAGISSNITKSSLRALVSAINKLTKEGSK